MDYIQLAQVCKINMGQSPESSTYNDNGDGLPFFQGNADFGEMHPVTRIWCKIPTRVAQAGDILISVRAPIGAMNYASEECCIGRGLAAITPNSSKISSEYIYWLLKSKNKELNSKGTGSTFKAIGKKVLEELQVPDICLKKQEEYVAVLRSVYEVVKIRRSQIQNLDNLIKARFVEMFGDPILNPKNWTKCFISDVVTDVRYGTSKPAVDGGALPYLRMNNLTSEGYLDLSNIKHIDVERDEYEKCIVRKGDVLFNRTNSIDLVGKTATFDLDEEMVIAGYIIRIRLGAKMLPDILTQYLNHPALKKKLRDMAKGAVNQANINAKELQSIEVFLPDIEKQRRFVEFKAQVDKSKIVVLKRLMLERTTLW